MFRLLQKSILLQWLITLGLLLFSGYLVFQSTIVFTTDGYPLLYQELIRWISNSSFWYRFWAFSSLMGTLTMIQIYFIKNKFLQKPSLLPSLFYLLFVITSGVIQKTDSILISNLMIMLIFISNNTYFKTNSKSKLFYTGLFFGIAVLFDFALIPLFIFIIISLIINTVISPKALLILLYGALTVVIYVVAMYYFTDHLGLLMENFRQIKIHTIFTTNIVIKPVHYVYIPFMMIIFIYILFKINAVYETKVIVLRKKMITFNTLVFCLLGTLLITHGNPTHFIGYLFVPMSMLFAIFSQFRSRFFIYDLLIIFFIVGLWF